MVYIFYTWNTKPFTQEKGDKYLSEIPALFREKILKLVRWEDRQNSLTGKLLLQYGLNYLYNHPTKKIESVQLSPFGKPFIPNSVGFNISHSEHCSICAFNLPENNINKSSDIGVDIERIKPIEFIDFFNLFTRAEQEIITTSVSPLHSFYDIWTRKESVLKAQGSGLTNHLNKFCVSKNSTVLDGNTWHTYPIKISHNYISHIAVKEIYPEIYIKYIPL
ncbi:MAG: 4'-phosphopantetheinyl transferase superfamily protein [Desulfamplus sp.]|nr:4'-phosphopantetheinyl transferase superfamily protein [Desulfamplus sp.]MBF0411818.1 4'-phosphopantetheinyl transferase superfamily protein [Desulfamplus sp.]